MKIDKINLNNEREITKHLKLKFKHNFEDKKIIERFFTKENDKDCNRGSLSLSDNYKQPNIKGEVISYLNNIATCNRSQTSYVK